VTLINKTPNEKQLEKYTEAVFFEHFKIRDIEKWLARQRTLSRFLDMEAWERLIDSNHFHFESHLATQYLERYVTPRIPTDYLKHSTYASVGHKQQLAPLLHNLNGLRYPYVVAYFGKYHFSRIIVLHCRARGRHGFYAFTFNESDRLECGELRPRDVLRLMLSEWCFGQPCGQECRSYFCDNGARSINHLKRKAKRDFEEKACEP
jgi:hypothetical protein